MSLLVEGKVSGQYPWATTLWLMVDVHTQKLNFIVHFGKFENLGKARAAASAALPSPTSACWVYSCFRNPPNSDMDYRICAYVIILMRVYTHGGLGTPTASQHNILDSEKTFTNVFLCSWRGSNLGSLDLESDALPTEPPRHPGCLFSITGSLHPVNHEGYIKATQSLSKKQEVKNLIRYLHHTRLKRCIKTPLTRSSFFSSFAFLLSHHVFSPSIQWMETCAIEMYTIIIITIITIIIMIHTIQ